MVFCLFTCTRAVYAEVQITKRHSVSCYRTDICNHLQVTSSLIEPYISIIRHLIRIHLLVYILQRNCFPDDGLEKTKFHLLSESVLLLALFINETETEKEKLGMALSTGVI